MLSSPYIAVDDTQWPLLTVRFVGEPTTPQVEEYLERMTAMLERGEKYVVLYDARRTTATGPAEQRQMQAAWIGRHEARLKELQLGKAFLFTSPLVRLSIGVVFHLKPPPTPYFMTGHMDSALSWLCERLAAGGRGPDAARLRAHFGLDTTHPGAG